MRKLLVLRAGTAGAMIANKLGRRPGDDWRVTVVDEEPEFLQQIVDSGGHLWACRMSADMQHLATEDPFGEVEDIISASDFIELTAGTQLLFI